MYSTKSTMPGLDLDNPSKGSSHLPSSSSPAATSSPSQQTIRNRFPATSTECNTNHTTTASKQPALEGSCGSHVTTTDSSGGVQKFTWKELSQLHQRHNAHVAYRGKVHVYGVRECECETFVSHIARNLKFGGWVPSCLCKNIGRFKFSSLVRDCHTYICK